MSVLTLFATVGLRAGVGGAGGTHGDAVLQAQSWISS